MTTTEEALREAQLDNVRLRSMLAAYAPEEHRPSSAVTPSGLDREGWLTTRLRGGVGMKTQVAALAILYGFPAAWDQPPARPRDRAEIVEALHEMIDETDRWKSAWSASTVDHDHKLREAMRQSESCEHHGQEIKELAEQLGFWAADRDRVESARLALVNFLQAVRDFVDDGRRVIASDARLYTAAEIFTVLAGAVKKAEAAHTRAFNRPAKTARP